MSKEDEYRRNARETMELANRAKKLADRGSLLRLAEKWLNLAERTRALKSRFGPKRPDHPLVRKIFGPEQPNPE